jgi:hypothetical protein
MLLRVFLLLQWRSVVGTNLNRKRGRGCDETRRVGRRRAAGSNGEAGPLGYNIAQQAEGTIMTWKDREIRVNRAFAAGGLDGSAARKVLEQAKNFCRQAAEGEVEQAN